MCLLRRRSAEVIAAEVLPGATARIDVAWPRTEIAGDFVLLDPAAAARETSGRDAPSAFLGARWRVFAVSGTGDAWLVSLAESPRIAFLDHDAGPDAVPQDLGLDFGQWLQLADLLRQVEADPPGLALDEVRHELDALRPGLADDYPYAFDLE